MRKHLWRVEVLIGAFAIAYHSTELATVAIILLVLTVPTDRSR